MWVADHQDESDDGDFNLDEDGEENTEKQLSKSGKELEAIEKKIRGNVVVVAERFLSTRKRTRTASKQASSRCVLLLVGAEAELEEAARAEQERQAEQKAQVRSNE